VARETGFADADALGRAFRLAFGLTPREARARHLVPPALAAPGSMTPNGGDHPMTDPTIREAAPVELAALPHRGPYPEIGRTFGALEARLGGTAPTGPAVGVYYDAPGSVPDEQLRAHAGVEVAPGAPLPEGIERVRLPGGRVAVLLHRGPYAGIAGAWDAAYRWLEGSGEEAGDAPPFERYLNDMGTVPEAELLTEICIPLRPR
jgi:AraC family transcriptional regulator